MNKEELFKAVLAKIKHDLKLAIEAVNMAYESATHEENILFNKATISKWGFRLGDVYIFFDKREK